MELFLHQVLAGLATGGIYACMALAVVMIYQAIDHLNFAQGEMAMFSTFIAWQLIQWGFPYWIAFGLTIVISFAAGVVIERVVLKPLHDAPVLSNVVAFIALMVVLHRYVASLVKCFEGTAKRLEIPEMVEAGVEVVDADEGARS